MGGLDGREVVGVGCGRGEGEVGAEGVVDAGGGGSAELRVGGVGVCCCGDDAEGLCVDDRLVRGVRCDGRRWWMEMYHRDCVWLAISLMVEIRSVQLYGEFDGSGGLEETQYCW